MRPAPGRPRRRWVWALIVFVAAVLAGLLIFLAVYAARRILHRPLPIESPGLDLAAVSEEDRDLLWANQKNLATTFWHDYDGERRDYPVHTNALGLRGPEPGEKGPRLRILALGDSTTFGMGVPDEEAWCAVLQATLDPEAALVQVLNGGCIGYSVYQSRMLWSRLTPALEPEIILLTAGHNEVARWGGQSDAELAASRRRPREFLEYEQLRRSLFEASPDGTKRPRMTPGEFLDGLLDFAEAGRQRGQALFFLHWPWRQEVFSPPGEPAAMQSYHALIREAGARARAPVVDLAGAFRALGETAFIPGDNVHASTAGNRAVAEEVARALRHALREGQCAAWQERTLERARGMLESGRPRDAHGLLQCFVRVAGHARGAELLGDACRELGDEETALQAWLEGMRLDPLYAPNFEKAGALLLARDVQEQVEFWRRAVEDTPGAARAWTLLARTLAREGRWTEAVEASRKAVETGGEDPATHTALGLALAETGDLRGAVEAMERALAIDPRNPHLPAEIEAVRRRMRDETAERVLP